MDLLRRSTWRARALVRSSSVGTNVPALPPAASWPKSPSRRPNLRLDHQVHEVVGDQVRVARRRVHTEVTVPAAEYGDGVPPLPGALEPHLHAGHRNSRGSVRATGYRAAAAAAAARSNHLGVSPYRWLGKSSPAAQHSISWVIRRARVASCLAEVTQTVQTLR